jgi:hypothetical protein
MKTASPPDEMLREVDWKQVVFIVAGVPAPVLFSMGGISATIGAPAWLVWTISFILTALLTAPNHFTAVGDPKGGWFFLPPWECWRNWARDTVTAAIRDFNRQGESLRLVRDGIVA